MDRVLALFSALHRGYRSGAAPEERWPILPAKEIERFFAETPLAEMSHTFDRFGETLARAYHIGDYSFEFCDEVVNDAYVEVVKRWQPGSFEYPLLFDEVYQAFDDGEWDHGGRWKDPVFELTKPAIEIIVSRLSSVDQAGDNS